MKYRTACWPLVILLLLAVGAGLACAKKPEGPAAEEKAAPGTAPAEAAGEPAGLTASAFVLNMRVLEGVREKAFAPPRPVTSSYLKFMNFANYELEEDLKADQQIRKVYSLKDVRLIATVNLAWEKGKAEKALYMFRLNGQEYLAIVTPGRLPERNQFRIEVYEQSGDQRANLLDTEFSLPDRNTAVFGFEDTLLKPYFITLKVVRWSGEPAGAPGGTVGGVGGGVVRGVVGGVLKSGAGDKVKPPELVKKVPPVYPDLAAKAGVEGVVIMEATTDTYGRVVTVKVLRSVPLLDQAAVDAVRQWVYEPMVIDGKPRPVVFTVTMHFDLDDRKKPQVSVSGGGVVGGVEGGVEGGVVGGVEGGVEGGVVGGVKKPTALEKFAVGAVRAEGEIEPPKLVKEVVPVYPEIARAAGVHGVVILGAKTDEEGKVKDVIVLLSIPLLDQAAIDAVRQWIYEPLVIEGKARPTVFTVTVRFELK